jgi:hypothetical protein
VLAHHSGVISSQALDEHRPGGRIQHDGELGVQSCDHCPRAVGRPGLRLDQVTDGLAKIIPIGVLHGHP